jgi:hypothetical protein
MRINYRNPVTGIQMDIEVDTFDQLNEVMNTLIQYDYIAVKNPKALKPQVSPEHPSVTAKSSPQTKTATVAKKRKSSPKTTPSSADIRQIFEGLKVPQKFI